jgi:hypothetical protein
MTKLEDLIVSGSDMDRELLGEILAPYVRLDKERCGVRPTEKWDELGTEEKILLYLVARKAMVALGFPIDNEEAAASEVINQTGLKAGTAYPTLRVLLQQRLIDQPGKRSGYLVPNHALGKVKSILKKWED